MAVRTEIHTARDTREWAPVVVSDAAFEALLFLSYLELERFTHSSSVGDTTQVPLKHHHTLTVENDEVINLSVFSVMYQSN